MRPLFAVALALAAVLAAPSASAHGALLINEFDTYALSDFEGQEDSFPWEGFEIWDVYVGDAYSAAYGSDGVYLKANFAGDGTKRPTGSAAWTLDFTFKVGEKEFARSLVHDGATVTSTFEELEWAIADGNVLQVRGWVPVPDGAGQAVTDLVVVSSVDGEVRDVAPGGVVAPGSGSQVPVEVPATPVFPAMGEGRVAEQVPLTGSAKFLDVKVTPAAPGVFDLVVTNPMSEQGQHVFVGDASGAWTVQTGAAMAELAGGASATFTLSLTPPASGVIEPLPLELTSDVGGRQLWYAYVADGEVRLVDDPAQAQPASIEAPAKQSPGAALPLFGVLAVGALLARRRDRVG